MSGHAGKKQFLVAANAALPAYCLLRCLPSKSMGRHKVCSAWQFTKHAPVYLLQGHGRWTHLKAIMVQSSRHQVPAQEREACPQHVDDNIRLPALHEQHVRMQAAMQQPFRKQTMSKLQAAARTSC